MYFLIDILKKLFNKIGVRGQGGFWGQVAGMGLSMAGASQQKSGSTKTTVVQPREYEEANKARGEWLKRLMDFGGEESFGAIGPNWDEIWEQARGKIRGFWGGTATTTGAIDKIKSEAARRNQAGGPAMAKNMLRASAAEGAQIKDLGVEQNLAKANFAESGRLNWMQSLQQLAGERAPQPQIYQENIQPDNFGADAMMGLGGGISDYFGAKDYRSWLEGIMNKKPGGNSNASAAFSGAIGGTR